MKRHRAWFRPSSDRVYPVRPAHSFSRVFGALHRPRKSAHAAGRWHEHDQPLVSRLRENGPKCETVSAVQQLRRSAASSLCRCRRHRKNDFGSDPPVLPDAKPVADHEKRPGCSILPRIRDGDGHRHIGLGDARVRPTTLSFEKSGSSTTGPGYRYHAAIDQSPRYPKSRPSFPRTGSRSWPPKGPRAIARTSDTEP